MATARMVSKVTTAARIEGRTLPENVRATVEREIDRLERMSEQSPENGWIRTWLDTVLELPWGEESEDRLDVSEAARILNEDHDGLDDVKDRILEHLAVRKLRAECNFERGRRAGERGPSSLWSVPQAWARRPWASQWPEPWVAVSSESLLVACATRQKSGSPTHLRRGTAGSAGPRPSRGRDDEPRDPSRRGRQVGRTTGATRRRPCSRCSTPRRTTRSVTTTSRSSSICPTCCSSRRRTSWTRSPVRCWTAWKSPVSTGTRRPKRSPSPAITWSVARSSARRSGPTRSR